MLGLSSRLACESESELTRPILRGFRSTKTIGGPIDKTIEVGGSNERELRRAEGGPVLREEARRSGVCWGVSVACCGDAGL